MATDVFKTIVQEQMAGALRLPKPSLSVQVNVGGYIVEPMAVVALTQRQAYLEDMFEETILSLAFTPTDYTQVVRVGHEDIIIKVVEQSANTRSQAYVKQYRGVLTQVSDEQIEANSSEVNQASRYDEQNIVVATFQLLSEATYDLRLREVSAGQTIFVQASAMQVLSYFLSQTRLQDRLNASEAVATINIDEVETSPTYRQIKIPEGTSWLAVADYLQEHYGLFAQGMGCFLKNQTWHVFAPYGLAKKDKDLPRLAIFNAPSSSYQGIENNLKIEGKAITVVTTGQTEHVKRSDAQALNDGTGVRYADLSAIHGQASLTQPDKDPVRTPDKYMTEYRASTYGSAYQKTKTSSQRFTDNPMYEASKLASRGGDVVRVVWENGILDPLVPGMPVKFHYAKDQGVEILYGTLISAMRTINVPLGGLVSPQYQSTVQLVLWLKR